MRSLRTRTPIFPIEIFQLCLWGRIIVGSVIASNGVLEDGIRLRLILRFIGFSVSQSAITTNITPQNMGKQDGCISLQGYMFSF